MKDKTAIYLDHAASTPTDRQVVEAMQPYFNEYFGNPSGLHQQARASARAVEAARRHVADILACKPSEVIFTACGTESDNIAIRGVAWAQKLAGKGNHLITSPIEHSAVSKTIDQLCKHFGFEQTLVPVDAYGVVNPDDVAAAIRPNTILISLMYANNEVGSLQPIGEVGVLARERGIPYHTDAVQAAAYEPLDVNSLNVDLLAISGHKIYAPKGIGILYARRGIPLLPPITGGGHENGRRPGTENVPYIVGIAKALELIDAYRTVENKRQVALRDQLIDGILQTIPDSRLTGHPTQRMPNNVSFVFAGCEANDILMRLDQSGIQAASGSACTSGLPEPSKVLLAMGLPYELSLSALRLTLGKQSTEAQIKTVLNVLPSVIEQVRQVNAVYP